MATVRLFEGASHAHTYSLYRPTYPEALVKLLLGYLWKNNCGNDSVVDIGCGSGQSTFQLSEYFTKCTGIDISKAQVNEARKKCENKGCQNVEFIVGNGMDLPMEAASVNVVTAAQAWHWLPDVNKFYSECKRVLKPGGCLAVYGYGNVEIVNSSCNSLIRDFYGNTLKGCWHKARQHIDNKYSEVNLPFANVERHDFGMPKTFLLRDFVGYVSSWSGYEKYLELNPGNTELQDLHDKLEEILSGRDGNDVIVETKFPLFVVMGQN